MFGTIVFQGENGYVEYLLADENSVRVVTCMQPGYTGMRVKLYRIEWPDKQDATYQRNTAVYNLHDAILVFKSKIAAKEGKTIVKPN